MSTQQQRHPETRSEAISSSISKQPFFVFKYNKFSGEFECDESDKSRIDQGVLFYMSKLNAILFNFQNTENHHSLIAMLIIYYPYFIMVLVLIVVLFVIVFTRVTFGFNVEAGSML